MLVPSTIGTNFDIICNSSLHNAIANSLIFNLGYARSYIWRLYRIMDKKSYNWNLSEKILCLFLLIILIRHWFYLFHINSDEHQFIILSFYAHFFIGFSASILSSLMGIGGGVLVVTIYYSIFSYPSKTVTQISVYVVLLNAWLNSLLCYRQLYWNNTLTRITLGGLLGAIVGIYIFQLIPEVLLQVIYGFFLIIILLRVLKSMR